MITFKAVGAASEIFRSKKDLPGAVQTLVCGWPNSLWRSRHSVIAAPNMLNEGVERNEAGEAKRDEILNSLLSHTKECDSYESPLKRMIR